MKLNEEERLISIIDNTTFIGIELIKEKRKRYEDYKEVLPPKVIEHLKNRNKSFLTLQQYNLSEIESLKELSLYSLTLNECYFKIENLVGDSCLPNLKSLHIDTYDSIDMETISRSFPNITTLVLKNISNISFKDYTGNKCFYTLNISKTKNPIQDLERYKEELSSIKYLTIDNIVCKEVPLLETSEVISLTLNDSKIDSFKLLSALKSLKFCELEGNNISEFNLIEYPNLRYLSLAKNKLENFRIPEESKLNSIVLSNNNIKTLEIISCPDLESITVAKSNLEKLVIRGCPSLTNINVNYNNLSDIDIDDGSSVISFEGLSNNFTQKTYDRFPNSLYMKV